MKFFFADHEAAAEVLVVSMQAGQDPEGLESDCWAAGDGWGSEVWQESRGEGES